MALAELLNQICLSPFHAGEEKSVRGVTAVEEGVFGTRRARGGEGAVSREAARKVLWVWFNRNVY